MVFYRKYRPQTIDDLDSAAVRDALHTVLQKNTPHAFLFTGPKGLGKTSTARILAKAINCTGKEKGTIEPCNTCDQCVSITNNTNVDILEIDAASNRGIDEIRDLKEKIRLAPVAALKKVYIIDEVHMLTTEAFNALLKTLEEPPAHALFVLCTTEPQKIPSTIISRCFHISFHLATKEELIRSFKRIVVSEKATVDAAALEMIAELADGGFRDGVKLLEESIAMAEGKTVTEALLEGKFNVSTITFSVSKLLESFEKKDTKMGLTIIAQLVEKGIDMKFVLQKLIETLHTQLLQKVTDGKKEKNGLSLEQIRTLFGLLSRAFIETKYAVLPQLPLELVLLEWGNIDKNKIPTHQELIPSNQVTVSSLRKQVGEIKRLKVLYGEKSTADQSKESIEKIPTSTIELTKTEGDRVTQEWLDHFWKNLLVEMKKHNHTVAGLLRGCTIQQFSKDILILSTAYKFHKERLDEAKTHEALVNTCKLLTGNIMEIKVELKKRE